MAIPKPEPSDWLKAAADELRQGDRAVLTLLQESYREVNTILKGLPDEPDAAFGNLIYRAQLERTRRELLTAQSKLFDKLGDKVSARRLRSASRAARLSAAADAALLRLVGEGKEGQRLYDGSDITSQRTIETILARTKLSAVPLAERIYKTSTWMHKRLDTLIATTMARGLNARKFARVARDWFSPSVPGGTRYAAMRLARTEINNAFHATSIDYASSKPWVTEMEWHLSKSHPTPDKCNELAAESPFPVREVPRKPHPQCMCYVTEVTPSEDDWIDRFVAGEFDDHLDAELAKADKAIGLKPEPVSPTPKPAEKVTPKTSVALPKTQAAAMEKFTDGMTRDEWHWNAGANLNAIDQLMRKGLVVKDGTKTVKIHGVDVQHVTYRRADSSDTARGNQVHSIVPKGLRKPGTLTAGQRRAFKDYESANFQSINGFRRNGGQPDANGKGLAKTTATMDEAFAESGLPADVEAWRGMTNSQQLFGDRFQHDMTGFSWRELAYGSTSTEEKVAKDFMVTGANPGTEVLMHIRVKAGTGAVQISDASFGNQAEILLQAGTDWKVTKDHGRDANGIRRLEIEVTPAPQGADGGGLQTASAQRADQPQSASSVVPPVAEQGYIAGAWKLQADKEEAIQEIERSLRKVLPPDEQQNARKMAEEFIAETAEESEIEFRNGPHSVRFTGNLTEQQQQTFLGYVDTLETKAPVGRKLHINVVPSSALESGVGGETTLATGYMQINEDTLKSEVWPGMPVSSQVSSALYVLAHEWGHAFPSKEDAREEGIHRHSISMGGMTRYGKTAPVESYAEAFAEWILTEGRTTNPAAIAYAKRFGWSDRFGI